LIGIKGRELLQKTIGDWWVFIEEMTFGEHISRDATVALDVYQNLFDSNDILWDTRFKGVVFVSFFPSLLFLGVGTIWWMYKYGLGRPLAPGEVGASQHVLIIPIILAFASGVMGIRLFGWLLRTLASIANSRYVIIIILTVCSYLAGIAAMTLRSIATANIFEFYIRPLY
jgi:hypothetical protein